MLRYQNKNGSYSYAWMFKSIPKTIFCLLLLFFFAGLRTLIFLFKDESRTPKPNVKLKSSSKKLSRKPFNWFILHKVVGGLFRRNYHFLSTSSLAIWSSSTSASTISVGIRVMSAFSSQFWGSILISRGSLNVLATASWPGNEFEFPEWKYSQLTFIACLQMLPRVDHGHSHDINSYDTKWQDISYHDLFDFSPSKHWLCSHEDNNHSMEFYLIFPLMIQSVFLSCSCLYILFFSKSPWTDNKVQHLLGEHTTTNPFYEHISSFDQIEIVSSSSNGMTQTHYWFLDLYEETLGNLLSTSLDAKSQISPSI